MDKKDVSTIIRNKMRPNVQFYINRLFPEFIEIKGDRLYGDDVSLIGGIDTLDGIPVTIIGQKSGRSLQENLECNFSMGKPEGFRKSLRLMKQAEKFGRPIICFVDTLGAYPGKEAEERGQGTAIANCLAEMMHLRTPIVSVLLGNGGSGGALALCVADKIIALQYATLGVISPKACANILWKDSSKEAEAAEALKMKATHLMQYGIVDIILPEPEMGAHIDPEGVAEDMLKLLKYVVARLMHIPIHILVKKRNRKYQSIGSQYLIE